MTTGVARPMLSAISAGGGGFGPGRNTPAKSTVGEPWAGATTLSEVRPLEPRWVTLHAGRITVILKQAIAP
jgi:hypothetical protein